MSALRTADDERFLRRALSLAESGWGRVHPNPLVGAVVVRDGAVIAEGFHGEYGGPHAEAVALESAGERARGATLYVTLEPCAHQGKTPPCADAIRRAGLARVVYGAEDPHDGRGGAALLRAAGIEVLGGIARDAVRTQNAAFFHAAERATTYVALKYALSLDARLAPAPGPSGAVTAEPARAAAHRLRAGYDALMVGIRTALADDPLLTVRAAAAPRRPPVRIVVDSEARLPTSSRLVRSAAEVPVWLFCAEHAPADRRRALERAGVRVLPVARGTSGVDLEALLAAAWQEGITSVLCEGGARLGSALLAADRVERLYLFYAPRLFGATGVAAFVDEYPPQVRAGWRLQGTESHGEDVLLVLDRSR